MKKVLTTLALSTVLLFNGVLASEVENISADEALKKLQEGNERFVKSKFKRVHLSKKRRKEMLKGQHPFVIILSCSDSRLNCANDVSDIFYLG